MEYGPHFQRIESVHFDRKAKTALAKICYPYHKDWEQRGGVYEPAFFDAVIHTCLVLVTDSTVYYAGGYEAAHFLRLPTVRARARLACAHPAMACRALREETSTTDHASHTVTLEWAHSSFFATHAQTDTVYVHFIGELNPTIVGRRSTAGDFFVYDGNGFLLFVVQVGEKETSPRTKAAPLPATRKTNRWYDLNDTSKTTRNNTT